MSLLSRKGDFPITKLGEILFWVFVIGVVAFLIYKLIASPGGSVVPIDIVKTTP